ncbi:MAG: type II secretion system secretin GspD [Deltaproteobacteria bacterium]|nr:type II secretion system secretin GspD [Deltaproteobacteria bacterium]
MRGSSRSPGNHSLGLIVLLVAALCVLSGGLDIAQGVRVSEEQVGGKPPAQAAPVEPKKAITPAKPRPAAKIKQPSVQPKPKPISPPRKVEKAPVPPIPVSRQQKPAAVAERPALPKAPEKRAVTIDFDNVDILLFIKFISEVTGKNFVIDQKVKGKITIISPTKISVDEAYKVFESVLEVHGFTTVEAGNVIKIVPSTVARGKSIETRLREEARSPEDKVVTQLIRLNYANPDELKKLFAPLISKSSVIVSYPPSGMLIVTDVASNIQRLLRIISAIDVVGIGAEISVVPLEHAIASVLIKPLTTIFQPTGRTSRRSKKAGPAIAPAIKIVADDRTNSLIISASEHDTTRIKELIKILDQETPRGTGDIRVHYLQYADAEELAKVLTALPSKNTKAAQQKGKAPTISKGVQIVADKATNSLVITANKQDYLALMDVIDKLDIPRPMVYIEALIMEVKADKDFRIGVEWRIGDDNIGSYEGRTMGAFGGSRPGDSSLIPTTATLSTGLTMGVLGESITIGGIEFPSIAAVARAFRSDSDVHILQTPQILTADNEEAEIQIVDNVPYLTKEASGDQQYQTYEYRDVGVKLKITPQINQDRFVRLKINQEYSTLAEGSSADKPSTLKRTADTTVVVKDSQTLVIGGLVGDQISRGTSGVPCLADIPGLGWLFKSVTRTRAKTNLFIFVTPHVLETPEEARKISDEKRKSMKRVEDGVIKLYHKPEDDATTLMPEIE